MDATNDAALMHLWMSGEPLDQNTLGGAELGLPMVAYSASDSRGAVPLPAMGQKAVAMILGSPSNGAAAR